MRKKNRGNSQLNILHSRLLDVFTKEFEEGDEPKSFYYEKCIMDSNLTDFWKGWVSCIINDLNDNQDPNSSYYLDILLGKLYSLGLDWKE